MPDNVLALLAKDFTSEDAVLQMHVKKGRLEMWWKGVAEAARKSVKDDGDRQGEETRRLKNLERGFLTAMLHRDRESLNGKREEGKGESSGERKMEVSMDKPHEGNAEGPRKVNGERPREVNGDTDVKMKMGA
jgi:hypothetical protein